MKNKNRTGRQKYIPSDRKCKNCVYNGGKRKGERVCLADTCIYTADNSREKRSGRLLPNLPKKSFGKNIPTSLKDTRLLFYFLWLKVK